MRAVKAEAEAEREKRAKIIAAQGEALGWETLEVRVRYHGSRVRVRIRPGAVSR
jgi:hypothetical protein